MPRIRTIKPEFPQSESMGRVSRDARLTFLELWTLADDEGRLRGNSRMLASLLFPYDDDAPGLIDKWLGELEREGCVIRYQIEKDSYIQICNWLIHQKIDHPSKSKIPEFAKPREKSRTLAVGSRIKDQGKDQGGDQPPAADAAPEWFPKEDWEKFLEHRGPKFTDLAKGLAIKQLERWRDAGHDPGDILRTSVMNGWKGLFEPKTKPEGASASGLTKIGQQNASAAKQWLEEQGIT